MRIPSLAKMQWHPELDYNAFCQCSSEYNGNFYDFIPLDNKQLALSFGDLPVGREVSALNVPLIQALIRGLTAGSREDLGGIARELNTTLHLLGPQGIFIPWFYLLIDPGRMLLRYVNAGHGAALLIRKGRTERLERTGAPLGLSPREHHRHKTASIEPGDILAVFSDGVPEDTVLQVVQYYPRASSAELSQLVLEQCRRARNGEDQSFAVLRVLDVCSQALLEDQMERALCAA